VRALAFFGGVPGAIVPDNLKSGVHKAHRYEPELNPAYQDFAEHYGVAILPARVRKPRDKSKVEVAVQVIERWILAALRDRQFFSLPELNGAIRELLERINARPFKKREGSRLTFFREVERAALRKLPERPYQYATWKKAKVHLDYHIEVERAYYSVPYKLIGETVDVRLTAHTLEIFYRQTLMAAHPRAVKRGMFSTHGEHRPAQHTAVVELTHERLQERAALVGPATVEVMARLRERRRHPDEALRANQGILRLARDFSPEELEAAARRALELQVYSYRAIRALIRTKTETSRTEQHTLLLDHENVRGGKYFQ
jgi:transposase